MLSQLLTLFGFFSLVLVVVYWINRAVVLFDQLIADGQAASVFLEFTALSLPSVIRLALPLASFAAAVYVTNRMTTESELIVVQATGYSPYRLARPVLYFGLIVAIMISALTHFLVPLSTARLADRQADIAKNVTARLLTEGQFIEPIRNVTFYIREVTPDGELRDIFLSDNRDPEEQTTYTAARAFLVREGGQTQLVMIDGLAQILRATDQQLYTTAFGDLVYDISELITTTRPDRRTMDELSTWELLNPTPALEAETRQKTSSLLSRAHERFSQALLGTIAALLGFSSLLIGRYSRFGVWRQIIGAIGLILVIEATKSAGLNMARGNASLWFATYLPIVCGIIIVSALLFIASRPALFRRRPKERVTA